MTFSLFGFSHLAALSITLIGILVLFIISKKFSDLNNYIRYSLISLMVIHIFYFFIGHWVLGSFEFPRHVPFHLCSISLYLSILTLSLNKRFLDQLIYLWALAGALGAVIFPELIGQPDFPSFTFNEFFMSHILIVWSVFYVLFFREFKLPYSKVWLVYLVLVGYSAVMYILNLWWGANYLFLMEKPGSGGPFAVLPDGFWYMPSVFLMVAIIFQIQWVAVKSSRVPFRVMNINK